ncbi:hypothetical protein [Pedobacter caeni]|uniref:DUF3108 domain-containing protein n=1 Tax=Pedobacter caeni TaxID=288992 RepID=A0A1M5AVN5_9SPHI|nr:hypothetical protein [Pedobacter caeni]SHF34147.1 hypothetical protein SAMN04488522_102903 [Pedobacter caeni]
MKKALVISLLLFVYAKTNAQHTDTLARCGRAPYLLTLKYSKPEGLKGGSVKCQFEKAGTKITYATNRVARYDQRFERLEIIEKLEPDFPSLFFYRISFDDLVVYVGNLEIQKFVDEFFLQQKDKGWLSLTKTFSSTAAKIYYEDRRLGKSNSENDFCFMRLEPHKVTKINVSLALRNILTKKRNTGKITSITGNNIQVQPEQESDFMPDVAYYIAGKPHLRVKFGNISTKTMSLATVQSIAEGKPVELSTKDVVTSLQE